MAGPGFPAPAHRALCAAAARIRDTQTPGGPASAAPTISASSPLRLARTDTPDNPAKPRSPSILCVSTAEFSRKLYCIEPSTVSWLLRIPAESGFLHGVRMHQLSKKQEKILWVI